MSLREEKISLKTRQLIDKKRIAKFIWWQPFFTAQSVVVINLVLHFKIFNKRERPPEIDQMTIYLLAVSQFKLNTAT